jgi:hypothetical protein
MCSVLTRVLVLTTTRYACTGCTISNGTMCFKYVFNMYLWHKCTPQVLHIGVMGATHVNLICYTDMGIVCATHGNVSAIHGNIVCNTWALCVCATASATHVNAVCYTWE